MIHSEWIAVNLGAGAPEKVKLSFGATGVLIHPYRSRYTWFLPMDAVAKKLCIEAQKRYAERMFGTEERNAEHSGPTASEGASGPGEVQLPMRVPPEAGAPEGVSGDEPLLPV